ncbi:hypothetical protein ACIBH1_44585 [Nonomuraea sp. NPDC050663]|uniref:hypothetical protein n=1 Tax=Nonomuraea sp. NPDC050663 TaxID=3364370 RepID=UPI0037AA9953
MGADRPASGRARGAASWLLGRLLIGFAVTFALAGTLAVLITAQPMPAGAETVEPGSGGWIEPDPGPSDEVSETASARPTPTVTVTTTLPPAQPTKKPFPPPPAPMAGQNPSVQQAPASTAASAAPPALVPTATPVVPPALSTPTPSSSAEPLTLPTAAPPPPALSAPAVPTAHVDVQEAAASEPVDEISDSLALGVPALLLILAVIAGLIYVDSRTRLPRPAGPTAAWLGHPRGLNRAPPRERHIGQHRGL